MPIVIQVASRGMPCSPDHQQRHIKVSHRGNSHHTIRVPRVIKSIYATVTMTLQPFAANRFSGPPYLVFEPVVYPPRKEITILHHIWYMALYKSIKHRYVKLEDQP